MTVSNESNIEKTPSETSAIEVGSVNQEKTTVTVSTTSESTSNTATVVKTGVFTKFKNFVSRLLGL